MPKRLLRIACWLLGTGTLLAVCGILGAYFWVSRSLPRVDTLADYRPPVITRVLSDNNEVIAEFYRERRIPVPVSQMPRQLIDAFVAAEDSKFFEHPGIDLSSIFRAALKNLQAGGIVQGGSTITQQVAKSLLLTPEKKFSRKFKEAILAWRMEKKLSKEDILYLYLNQIYLGHGSYGVQAAAENYFGKNVQELSLAECALLAGLPQAPSRYSPYRNFAKAKERQRYVLKRLIDEGKISEGDAETAAAEKLTIHPRVNSFIADASYFTEQVRRYLIDRYGEERVYTDGLEVHTTMNLGMQQAATTAVRENLREHDKRQGFRGPQQVLAAEEQDGFLQELDERLEQAPPKAGDILDALLIAGDARALQVKVGKRPGLIPQEGFAWAGKLRVVPLETYQRTLPGKDSPASVLPVGTVLQVRIDQVRPDGSLLLKLEQEPDAQGALVAIAPGSGEVKAMVGGFDFATSQFNRATQAHRLPGSAIKPLIYAAALDKGYTPASVILDTPIIYKEVKESGEETEWKPHNYGEQFYGPTSVRTALTKSQNVITIKILEDIGINYAANYARKLGIVSPLNRDLTLALGSSAVTPMEMATAYTVFASGGIRVTPAYVSKILDRNGRVLESVDAADFPNGPEPDQLLIRQSRERVISPETAYLITNLMESVVRNGTGWRAKALGRPAAGKTGTTNDLKDAWFIGFIPQLVAVSWVGYDQERPLGEKETGSKAAAPAWVEFMTAAEQAFPAVEFPVPDSIEFRTIDPKTGLLVTEDTPGAIVEAFAPGSAPTHYALDESRPRARDFFRMDLDSN